VLSVLGPAPVVAATSVGCCGARVLRIACGAVPPPRTCAALRSARP